MKKKILLFSRKHSVTPIDERFIITVKTDNAGTSGTNQFTIPTSASGITQAFNYDIETSDGQTITGVTGNHTITFPSAGTYDIYISGSFPYIYFNNGGDRQKLLDVKNFGIYALGSTSQDSAFYGCSNMVISATDSGNFGSVTNFNRTWILCSSLTSFPLIDTSSGTIFGQTWRLCSSLTSFPLINTSSGTNFEITWFQCTSLTSFPANAFDGNIASNYGNAFNTTNLTTQSIDDILVSLDTSGVSNGTFTQSGGSAPSAIGEAAIDALIARGWTITVTGGYPANLNTAQYDAKLIAYESTLQTQYPNGVGYPFTPNINFGTNTYSTEGAAARQSLIDNFNWTITDGGGVFEITVDTTQDGTSAANQFTLSTFSGTYDYNVVTSDGQELNNRTGSTTITFPTAGIYDIQVKGQFPYIRYSSSGDAKKLINIKQWGGIQWENFSNSFDGCSNLTISATDAPDLSGVTSLARMFKLCTSLINADFSHWDASTIRFIDGMFWSCNNLTSINLFTLTNSLVSLVGGGAYSGVFYGCTSLISLDLTMWDVSNVTVFSGSNAFNELFGNCTSLTSINVSNWDTSNGTNFRRMFQNCSALTTLNLSSFNMSNAIYIDDFFEGCTSLASIIGIENWDLTNVINIDRMFNGCESLDGIDFSLWNPINAVSTSFMFYKCKSMTTINLSGWSGSSITSVDAMFYDCNSATTIIPMNITNLVTSLSNGAPYSGVFGRCSSLVSLDLTHWDVSNIGLFSDGNFSSGTFQNCTSLTTLNVANWNTSNGTNFFQMFNNTPLLTNMDLSGWNTSSANNMQRMFRSSGFDGDISSWDITNVSVFNEFLLSSELSTVNYDLLLVEWENTLQATYPNGVGYPHNIGITFGNSQYTLGGQAETARTSLINNFGWTIVDGGGI